MAAADSMSTLVAWRTSTSLTSEEREWCSDATLRRYANARPKSGTAAVAMIQATLEWRRTAVAAPLHCPRCDSNRASHCFVPIGVTDGSVMVYGAPARASDPDVEGTVRHVVHSLEHAFSNHSCETWTWIVDFNGFGLTHALQARLSVAFARVFADHFPERLRELLLLNPPMVFSILLAACEPFADARTMSKVVRIFGSPAEVAAAIGARGIPPAQSAWVQQVLSLDARPGLLPPLPSGAGDLMPRGERPGAAGAVDVWPEAAAT